jgi:hypothetical protein
VLTAQRCTVQGLADSAIDTLWKKKQEEPAKAA